MAQPIRKKIQEIHPDMIKEEPFRTLLVDGNSLLFLCFKDDKTNPDTGIHYGAIYQFLLQLNIMLSKGEFEYVYVFFDNEYSGYMRYKIYPQYKANRDKHYNEYGTSDYYKQLNATLAAMRAATYGRTAVPVKSVSSDTFIDENFDRERDCLINYFEELYIRSYIDDIVEGDDLISYYCNNKKDNERIIIMSGDMDLMQLLSDDISIYNLHQKKFITTKNFKEIFGYTHENIMVKKIFCGDTSDNIGNIKLLSEDAFYKMMPEAKDNKVTIEDVKNKAKQLIEERKAEKKKPLKVHENILNGVSNKEYNGDFYEINEKLINLKKPMLTDEAKEVMDSMMYAPQDPEGRSFKNIYQYVKEDGIVELYGDTKFSMFFAPFKKLAEKEQKRFEKSQN